MERRTQQARRFIAGEGSLAGMRSACGVRRAVGLADYRWALPHISIVLPQQRNPYTDGKSTQ